MRYDAHFTAILYHHEWGYNIREVGGADMDVLRRLAELQQQYGWSDYRIAKEAGLSPNTVSNIYRRNNVPSMATLEALCNAFGITLAQFFADNDMIEVTPEIKKLVEKWSALSEAQKAAIWQVLKTYEK